MVAVKTINLEAIRWGRTNLELLGSPILRKLSLFGTPGSLLKRSLSEIVFIWLDWSFLYLNSPTHGICKNNQWQLFKIAAAWGSATLEIRGKKKKS